MSDQNIKGQDHYRVANAVKTRNIRELIECINLGIVQFNVRYGPFGTILDYGLNLNNMELLGVIYLAILESRNFDKITLHPKRINQQFVEIIKSFEKEKSDEGRSKLEFKIAVMLDLKLINFAAHVPNDIFRPNYKILDLALSLHTPYIFNGLVGYLLNTGMNYDDICKLISFDISANEILFDRDHWHTVILLASRIPNEYIIKYWRSYHISETQSQDEVELAKQKIKERIVIPHLRRDIPANELEHIVEKVMKDVKGYVNFIPEFVSEVTGDE